VTAVDVLPVAAALFAVPQFVPQVRKLRRTDDTVGLSSAWGLLTAISNAGWFCYFAASKYWFALVPSSSASLLGGALGVAIARPEASHPRSSLKSGALIEGGSQMRTRHFALTLSGLLQRSRTVVLE
jgi:hypothetical protein